MSLKWTFFRIQYCLYLFTHRQTQRLCHCFAISETLHLESQAPLITMLHSWNWNTAGSSPFREKQSLYIISWSQPEIATQKTSYVETKMTCQWIIVILNSEIYRCSKEMYCFFPLILVLNFVNSNLENPQGFIR